jgi:hypothetical protein
LWKGPSERIVKGIFFDGRVSLRGQIAIFTVKIPHA